MKTSPSYDGKGILNEKKLILTLRYIKGQKWFKITPKSKILEIVFFKYSKDQFKVLFSRFYFSMFCDSVGFLAKLQFKGRVADYLLELRRQRLQTR